MMFFILAPNVMQSTLFSKEVGSDGKDLTKKKYCQHYRVMFYFSERWWKWFIYFFVQFLAL